MTARLLCVFGMTILAWGQTMVDLGKQGRNIDFSSAVSTKPVKTGTILPATCSVGEVFFKTDAAAGANLYFCVAANIWSGMAASGGTGGTGSSGSTSGFETTSIAALPVTCNAGEARFVTDATLTGGGSNLYVCVTPNNWVQSGYTAGGTGALSTNCATAPCSIDVTASVPLKASANAWLGTNDFSKAAKTAPFQTGATDPAVCDETVREFFFNTTTNLLKVCTAANVWSVATSGAASGMTMPVQGWFAPNGLQFATPATAAANWSANSHAAMVCTQFVAPYAMSVGRIAVMVGTAPASGKAIAAGVMNADLTTMLAQGKLVNPAAGDNAVIPMSTQVTLAPGVYYQCVGAEDTTTTLVMAMAGTGTTSFGKALNASATPARIVACSNVMAGAGATFQLPAACGTAVASDTYPLVASVLLP